MEEEVKVKKKKIKERLNSWRRRRKWIAVRPESTTIIVVQCLGPRVQYAEDRQQDHGEHEEGEQQYYHDQMEQYHCVGGQVGVSRLP